MNQLDNKPLVSVVIPVFNRSSVLPRALDSVIGQTYTNWECLVVDDGSTDLTLEIVDEYILRDSRITKYNRDSGPKGANTCRNLGIEYSQGDFVAFLDSDDTFLADHLAQSIEFLDREKIDGCFSGAIVSIYNDTITRNSRKLEVSENMFSYLVNGGFAQTSGIVVRKAVAEEIRWDEGLQRHQDYDFLIRLSAKYIIQSTGLIGAQIFWDVQPFQKKIDFNSCIVVYERYRNSLSKRDRAVYLLRMYKYSLESSAQESIYYYKELMKLVAFLTFDEYKVILGMNQSNATNALFSRLSFICALMLSGIRK